MRIGLFAHRLAQRHPTGIGRYFRELVSALGEVAGNDQAIVLSSTREAEPAGWVPTRIETRVLPWPRRPVQAAWCLGVGPRLEGSLGVLDVAHLMHPFPPVRTAAPQVITVQDLFPFEHPDWYPRSERWSYRRSMELALDRATRIVVPSRYIAHQIASTLGVDPPRIEVVALGVSGTFARARPAERIVASCARFGVEPGRFAVCVGAVSTRKNAIALVRAIGKLGGDGIPLVMIGPDGHGARVVEAEIARLDGAVRVIRTGFLPDDETAALVQGAAVLAHPTLGEGFGFVPLEAMAAGTPVIAARSSSIPEVVGGGAVLVDEPLDPVVWAAALTEVIGSAERRSELVAAGERHVATFSWEQTARKMLEIYAETARS